MTVADDLNARLDALTTATAELHEELAKENVKRDQRIRTNRQATRSAMVVGVLGVLVGVLGVTVGAFASSALHDFKADTRAARVASCAQFNNEQDLQIADEMRKDRVVAANVAPLPRDHETQLRVDAFLTQADAATRSGHPHRDCSPHGISAYLESASSTSTKGP